MKKCYLVEFDRLINYREGLEIQESAFNIVKESEIDGIILLLQHNPVFTIGRDGGENNILISRERINKLGIEIYETNRGGNVTYHGPGQLVAYPILNLKKIKKDVHWYIRQLEEVVIQTLKTYGIIAGRKDKYTGVWVGDTKITAIGVHVKRWITMHGFAFNICVNKDHFRLINPCGITEFGIASLNDFVEGVKYSDILMRIEKKFEEVFDIKLIKDNEKLLRRE